MSMINDDRSSVIEIYDHRIKKFKEKYRQYKKREKFFPFLRLFLVIGGFLSLYLSFSFYFYFFVVLAVLLGIAFLGVIRWHDQLHHYLQQYTLLININRNEYQALQGEPIQYFDDGAKFQTQHHAFNEDLNIFGSHSLYHLINRTVTPKGGQRLAYWLKNPAGAQEVRQRQAAVKELTQAIDWRQNYIMHGLQGEEIDQEMESSLFSWLSSPNKLVHKTSLRIIVEALTLLTTSAILLSILGYLPPQMLLFFCFRTGR